MDDSRLRFEDEELLKDVIMLAGQVLSESGAEGTRIEGTMDRIAYHYGYTNCNSFATNTVINFSLHTQSYPRVFRIKKRNTNLSKISKTADCKIKLDN
ncbi:threonine/serine exporter family protein [Macrococcus brunensis]|nr:threonine/serine exporter family protein [Macrococcus brunensis]ULG71979.1 threonine/serine exporter family protein [Macrococcus brunensis]